MLSFIIVFTRFHLYLKTFAFQQQSDTQTRKFIYKSPTRNPKWLVDPQEVHHDDILVWVMHKCIHKSN